MPDASLEELFHQVAAIPGDYAEVGVYQGHTFKRALRLINGQRKAHAFDSFQGCNEPGEYDGGQVYHKGRFDVGGVEAFRQIIAEAGVPIDKYSTSAGFIPECFKVFEQAVGLSRYQPLFAAALVDVDHYLPTLAAIKWIWRHLAPGGIMVLDDYTPGINNGRLATRAIQEWLETPTGKKAEIVKKERGNLWVRKPTAATA